MKLAILSDRGQFEKVCCTQSKLTAHKCVRLVRHLGLGRSALVCFIMYALLSVILHLLHRYKYNKIIIHELYLMSKIMKPLLTDQAFKLPTIVVYEA